MSKYKIHPILLCASITVLVLSMIGITHSLVGTTPSASHTMPGHQMTQHGVSEIKCQVSCTITSVGSLKPANGDGRMVVRPQPIDLVFSLLLLIISVPLAVSLYRVYLLSSWRPPDIPLLSGKLSVSL